MNRDWNDFFDSLPEEEILAYFPGKLPEMQEELAEKRIEASVAAAVKAEEKRRWGRKRAAAACCFVVAGLLGYKPILAAFERVFHVLPGVGLYINDSDEEIFEVRLLNPVQEKDGVRLELEDFYCKDGAIYGIASFTGEGLPDELEEGWEISEGMKGRFPMSWFDGEKERSFVPSSSSCQRENGEIVYFSNQISLYLGRGADPRGWYEFRVAGFDEPFRFEVAEPQTLDDVGGIGYSMAKNGTTVAARAYLRENGIEVEYFVDPSEEVRKAEAASWFEVSVWPYHFEAENYFYIQNAKGQKLEQVDGGRKRLLNGWGYLLEGTAEDFPLTLHRSPFTGTDDETHAVSLPLPADGETRTENLPKVEFRYGTVEFLSVERSDEIWVDDNENLQRTEGATRVTFTYQIKPEDGLREMYVVDVDIAQEAYSASRDGDWSEEGGATGEGTIFLERMDADSIELALQEPSYWIAGDYDLVIEKPEKE